MHIKKYSYTFLLYIYLTSKSSEMKYSAYDGPKHDHHEGAVALSARDEPTLGGMPLLKSYIEFSGIHSDLFFASE